MGNDRTPNRNSIYTDSTAPHRIAKDDDRETLRIESTYDNYPFELIADNELKSTKKVGEAPIVRDDSFGNYYREHMTFEEDEGYLKKVEYPDTFGGGYEEGMGFLELILLFPLYLLIMYFVKNRLEAYKSYKKSKK